MKQKFTYLLFLLTFSSLIGIASIAIAQSVSGTATTTGCKAGGTITAVATGLGATPQFQLLKGGVVIGPVAGDATQFTNIANITGLPSGTDYSIRARANATGTIYTSANITVANGYTDMALSSPTKVLSCAGGTAALTTSITGGKGDYIYSIATQAAPGTPLQTSATTSALTFTFNALPAGSYLVSVTDNCGITSTVATSISNPALSLSNIKLGSIAYVNRQSVGDCTAKFNLVNELGFRYIISNTNLSAADAALFTWKIKFQGVVYGQDTDADGYPDAGGPGFSALTNNVRIPLLVTRAAILADEPNTKIVLIDACGNQKEFPIVNYNKTNSTVRGQNSCGNAQVTMRIGAGMSCLPINFVFTNSTNAADVVTVTQTVGTQTFGGFTPGATYNFTYVDAAGYTSGLYSTNSVAIPSAPEFNVSQFVFGTQQSLNNLNYGVLGISVAPSLPGDAVTATVTASNNPLVSVGASVSGVLDANKNILLPRINATDPIGFWPKGNYTLSVSSGCGTKLVNVVVQGYNASLSGYTATPICGGFNYVMNGTFDVPSAYQVIIVSAPNAGDVGQVRDLASTSASLPFNSFGPGTYVFGLRIKGGTTNIFTQTVVYNSTSVITIDRNNTGGFVCSVGATNGTLTITASSVSPAPNNALKYALSTDDGVTYGTYQVGNTFAGLGAGTYYFKVKDGCNNEVTSTSQIGVAASPIASVNGISGTATFCAGSTSSKVQLGLDINIGTATYLWTGAGLSTNPSAPNYQGLKSPVIALTDIPIGNNTYSVFITLGAPCNTTSTGSVDVFINGLPTVITNAPAAPCFPGTVDLKAAAVTAGSSAGLTYSYFTDAAGLNALLNPESVAISGSYYIKGSNGTCSDIKPVTVTINPLPIAGISYAAAPYCKRGTATVTQTGQAGGTYTSDAGLAINATTGAIDLSSSTAGAHIVTYTYTNGTCGSSTATTITINANTLPPALADFNAVCSATPTAPTLSDPCAGVLTAKTSTVFPITIPGTTVVTWLFDYGNGYTQSVNQNVIITQPATPTITPASATSFCLGGSVDLSSTVATAYRWYRDGILISGANSQNYNATTSGNYSIETGNGSCYSIASTPVMVTVNPIPATPTVTAATPTTVCTGESVVLSSSSATGNQWYKGGVIIPGETNQTYTANTSGNYRVVVTTTGCPSAPSALTTVTVNPIPATPTVTAATPTTFCTGESVVLSSSSATGNQWYRGGVIIPGETNQTYTANTSGNYRVVVTTTGCPSAPSAVTTVTVNPIPATPTVTASTVTTFCNGGSVVLSSSSATGNQWYKGGVIIPGETNQTYTANASGNYTVVVITTGCPSAPSSGTTVTVNPIQSAPVVAVTAQPVCGTPTGSITITGVTGETYSVDGSGYTSTLTYSGLESGSHTIAAKSVDGCISEPTNITINQAKTAALKPVVAVTAQPVCGTPTGSITITGIMGETYSVDGSGYTSTLTYSDLESGSHTIAAKSIDGCISEPTNITINQAKTAAVKPVVAVTAQPVCGTPTGSITITGIMGETYSVDGSGYTSTLTYSDSESGPHTITAKSVDGCISEPTNITINQAKTAALKPVATITAQPVCGTPTGSITITGVTGETYSVDGSAFISTLTYAGLTPGSHTVTAKSIDGCISESTDINISPAKSAAIKPVVAITTQPVCGTPTGSITITGVTGETYSVDGSAFTSTLTYAGLIPGSHTVTAKSMDGCISESTNITISSAKVEAVKPVVAVTAQPVCGTPTGSITITGVTGETYSVDGSAFASTLTYAGLISGSHMVTAKSIDGCISEPTNITISSAKVEAVKPVLAITTQPVCGTPTGSITITGVTGETYSVDGSAFTSTLTYAGLTPGSHNVTAKSIDGCISNSIEITINSQPAVPTASISYNASEYQPTGFASVSQAGQTGGTYTASPLGLSINGSTGAINLAESTPNQTYVVMYTFSNGTCSGTAVTTVRLNATPAAITYDKPEYCAIGTAEIIKTGPSNGVYSASSGGLKINTSTGTINLGASSPGKYSVAYKYQDGTITALATTSVIINEIPKVSISSDLETEISKGNIVILSATGGTKYTWTGTDIQSGQNTNTLNVRPKQTSTYTVTAINDSGCSDVAQITIQVADDFKIEPNNVITPNGDGKNDTWVVKNLDYYPNNTVGIYDRAGRKVYGTSNYKGDWDGTYNGQFLAEGAYVYVIDLGKGIGVLRGTISIIRDNR